VHDGAIPRRPRSRPRFFPARRLGVALVRALGSDLLHTLRLGFVSKLSPRLFGTVSFGLLRLGFFFTLSGAFGLLRRLFLSLRKEPLARSFRRQPFRALGA
jgi:hypothetical protein